MCSLEQYNLSIHVYCMCHLSIHICEHDMISWYLVIIKRDKHVYAVDILYRAFRKYSLILLCCSLNSKRIKYFLSLTHLHTIPRNDKVKTCS
jgi:hypothetical protein